MNIHVRIAHCQRACRIRTEFDFKLWSPLLLRRLQYTFNLNLNVGVRPAYPRKVFLCKMPIIAMGISIV